MQNKTAISPALVWRGNISLLICALIWGFAFVPQRTSMDSIGPFALIGIRFIMGAFALVPLILYRKRQPTIPNIPITKPIMLGGGVAAGLFLFGGASLQQIGLQSTTAGKAGFITGMYILIVPLLGLLWGQKAGRFTWAGIVLAVIGMYFLTVTEQLTIERGDLFVLLCAVVFAGHVQTIDYFAKHTDPIKLSAIQFLVTGILGLIATFAAETVTWEMIQGALPAILYLGLLSSGVGYTLQVVGQQYAQPANASIIMSLEAPFAALGGWLLLSETLDTKALVGCGLMLTGMLVSQIRPRRQKEKTTI